VTTRVIAGMKLLIGVKNSDNLKEIMCNKHKVEIGYSMMHSVTYRPGLSCNLQFLSLEET